MGVFLTGDIHGDINRIKWFCGQFGTTKDDLMVILGDVGTNYFGDERDDWLKGQLEKLPLTFMLIRGNHERRPVPIENGGTYHPCTICRDEYAGTFLVEPEYPSLLFAIDDERYLLNGKVAAVYGGAYSVDKHWRLVTGSYWFLEEQMTEAELDVAYDHLVWASHGLAGYAMPDIVLSHTCPYKFIPREMFLGWVDQATVDNTMEHWFDRFELLLPEETKWYCGHWHTDKVDGRMRFMFQDIIELE